MSKQNTLAQGLHKYDMESLHAYCAEYDLPYQEKEKDDLCEQLAAALIHEGVLVQRLGILDDAALQGLYDLIEDRSVEDEDIIDHLDGLDLIYGNTVDHQWHVPQEVKDAMSCINEEWQKERRSRVWLMQCLSVVQHDWADVPFKIMKELYLKNENVDPDADLKKLFQQIPVSEVTCVIIGDAFVIRGWRSSEVFAGYREKQKKYSFAMLDAEEVYDLYENDYDTLSTYSRRVKEWFLKNGAEEDDLELLLHELWNDMNYGHAETEIMKEAESVVVFDNSSEREQFRQMIHAWYSHARRIDLRGHCIAEQEDAR